MLALKENNLGCLHCLDMLYPWLILSSSESLFSGKCWLPLHVHLWKFQLSEAVAISANINILSTYA